MQTAGETIIPRIPVESPEFDADPMPFIREARKHHPWLAEFSLGYFVHGYEAVRDFCGMDDVLRPSFDDVVKFYGAEGTEWGNYMEENIIGISGERHRRIRSTIALAFSPKNVKQLRGAIRNRITETLDVWAPRGNFDFAEFIADFPISILCELLGTPVEDLPKIRYFLETQGRTFSLNRDLLPDFFASYDVMLEYLDERIRERELAGANREGALLDILIRAKDAGTISDAELRNLLMILFPAGYDTSRNLLAMAVYTMLDHPQVWQRCAEDLEYCGKAMEEVLRYVPVATPFRTVATRFEYDGIAFEEGTKLFLGNTVAGRDPVIFPDSDRFDPEHNFDERQVAFGRGAHICVGQYLAKLQTVEAMHLICKRITKPRLAGKPSWRIFMGSRGPTSMPIEFEPA